MSVNPLGLFDSDSSGDIAPTKINTVKTFSPKQQVMFEEWKQKMRTVFRLHAFNPVEVPPDINRTFLHDTQGGSLAMPITKRFRKGGQNKFGVVYNRSASFALWLAHYFKEIVLPYKRFDINYSYSPPTQSTSHLHGMCAVEFDIAGRELSLSCEADCITTLSSALEKLEAIDFVVYINHVEIPKKIIAEFEFSDLSETMKILEKLRLDNKEEIIEELSLMNQEIEREKIIEVVELLSFRGPLDTFKHSHPSLEPFFAEIKEVLQYATMSGMDSSRLQFTPAVVKDMHQYTGVFYEVYDKDHLSEGKIGQGGRNHRLIERTSPTLKDIQLVNGTINLSKIFQFMLGSETVKPHIQVSAKVIVLYREKGLQSHAFQAAAELRKVGISTDIYSNKDRDLKSQLHYADKAGFGFGFLVMDQNVFVIRDLRAGEQSDPIDSIEKAARQTVSILDQVTFQG